MPFRISEVFFSRSVECSWDGRRWGGIQNLCISNPVYPKVSPHQRALLRVGQLGGNEVLDGGQQDDDQRSHDGADAQQAVKQEDSHHNLQKGEIWWKWRSGEADVHLFPGWRLLPPEPAWPTGWGRGRGTTSAGWSRWPPGCWSGPASPPPWTCWTWTDAGFCCRSSPGQ